MKKLTVLLLTAFVAMATPALADWKSDLNTAIATGDADKVAAVAATYPDNQPAIALELMSQSQTLLATNPTLATSLYKTASTLTTDIPATGTSAIVAAVEAFTAKAKDATFQSTYPQLTAVIFSTSLKLASLPNVVAVAPNLYQDILTAANEFLDKKPISSADISDLEDSVLLAQNAGFTPPGPTGANGAIADPTASVTTSTTPSDISGGGF